MESCGKSETGNQVITLVVDGCEDHRRHCLRHSRTDIHMNIPQFNTEGGTDIKQIFSYSIIQHCFTPSFLFLMFTYFLFCVRFSFELVTDVECCNLGF